LQATYRKVRPLVVVGTLAWTAGTWFELMRSGQRDANELAAITTPES
jgi:hypothetical protein